uniref:Uncharacterized protein n=1 Tax=Periophthalmus magnuspinnatus TaxID=409849 RepID=A0A3B4B6I2_9GOBI
MKRFKSCVPSACVRTCVVCLCAYMRMPRPSCAFGPGSKKREREKNRVSHSPDERVKVKASPPCLQANSRLKEIEKDYSQKLTKSAQLIAELQTCVCDSKEEAVRLQKAMERQLEEAHARWDEQRKTLHHHADQSNKALQEKVESLQMQLHSSEKKLLSKALETEEKVTAVRQEYEEKIKGLMPSELRQELEDTITSLKSQVRDKIM